MNAKQARAYAKTVKPGVHKDLVRFFNAAREHMENGCYNPGDKIRMTYSSLLIGKDQINDLWDMGYVIETIPVVGSFDNYLICW